jgi:hypothetical protein
MISMLNELLSLDELEANTRELIRDAAGRVEITPVGESWAGRPIEMLSIGTGSRDVLIVGGPHPNEPVGSVTVERLIGLMLGPDGSRQRRGLRWHFIKAIDPEGLRLNAGWLHKPRTFQNYFLDFFRPALDRQPDTTFPVSCPQYRFDRATPENQAWQKAFDYARPILHASLHNCEFGGSFHVVSRALPELTPTLDQIIVKHGLTPLSHLDQVGLPLEWLSPGVARAPSVPEIVAAEMAAGLAAGTSWPTGEMSTGYGEARFGTFTIVSEVPLWDDIRLRDDGPSGFTSGDQLQQQRQSFLDLAAFFRRHLDGLAPRVSTQDGQAVLAAAREMAQWVLRSNDFFDRQASSVEATRQLPMREYLQKAVLWALVVARGYAMIGRLSRMFGANDPTGALARAATDARKGVARMTAHLESADTLRPVDLSNLTGIQMDAILAAADYLTR